MNYSSGRWSITPAVKNLLIINVLVFLAANVFENSLGIDFNKTFGLHYYLAENFGVWQFVTFMFLHSGFSHVFFNMFAVYMFGRIIEQVWGTQRFLIYYFVTGIGSGIIQELALYFDINPFIVAVDNFLSDPSTANLQQFINNEGAAFSSASSVALSSFINEYNSLCNTDLESATALARKFIIEYQAMFIEAHVTIGASGAVFGVLLAFGMLFPNMTIMLLIPPIPIKAKYFVLGYGLIELFQGVANFSYDNVAHWAHLGGMLFGFFLIRHWRKTGEMPY